MVKLNTMKKKKQRNEYQRGYKHGRLNVYNPGVLFGRQFKRYLAGYKAGMLAEKPKI